MAITIKDFILQLGFDSSEIDKGLAGLERKLSRASKLVGKRQSQQDRNLRATQEATAREITSRIKLEEMANRQNSKFDAQRASTRTKDAASAAKAERSLQDLAAKRITSQMKLEETSHRANTQFDAKRVATRTRDTAKSEMAAQSLVAKRISSQMKLEETAHRQNAQFDAQRSARASQAVKMEQAADLRRQRSQTAIERSQRKATFRLGGFGTEASAAQLRDVSRQLDILRTKAKRAVTAGDFSRVASSLSLVNQQTDIAIAKTGALTRKINAQKFALNAARDSARNLGRSYISLFAVVAAGRSAIRTGQGFESIQASLLAASGSTKKAAEDFEFVKKVSLELGRDLTASARGFQQIAVSALDAGLSMDQAKDLFLAGSEAATAFGLSTSDTFGVFRAFTQIISKGTVSSEELLVRFAA